MDDKQKIGMQIFKLRKKNNYTQNDLAKILHVSFQAVSKWERGISLPDLDTLHKICDIFHISFNYFLFDAYSALALDKLVQSVNETGISRRNFRSIGALVRSGALSENIIEMFNDIEIKKTLRNVLENKEQLMQFSDIKQDHEIVRLYANILSLSFDFKTEYVNGISCKYAVIESKYSELVYAKTLLNLTEGTTNELYFIILLVGHVVEYRCVCSKNLIDKGVNCFYITELLLKASLKKLSIGGISGGGQSHYAGFKADSSILKMNHIEESVRLLIDYISVYNKDYKIGFITS